MPAGRIKGRRVVIAEVSTFARLRKRISAWWKRHYARWATERQLRREMRGMRSMYRLEHDDIAAVAVVLESDWDDTGLRLAGVPHREFRYFATEIVADIKCGASNKRIAEHVAHFEAELGLRDSAIEHRVELAERCRQAARHSAQPMATA